MRFCKWFQLWAFMLLTGIWLFLFSSSISAEDCNENGIFDLCDITCGNPGGSCDIAGCGQSTDCNANGTPDECEPSLTVIHVDDDATGNNTGSDWANAFTELQSALNLADCNRGLTQEIWVAEGVYTPDYDPLTEQHTGDQQATFHLLKNVSLYGGFTGTETERTQRDWVTYETVLSGDLAGNDYINGDKSENSYNVVTFLYPYNTANLNGFTIRRGHAYGPADQYSMGGGLHNIGSLVVKNCLFTNNTAHNGGAVCNLSGIPYMVNCIFAVNSATNSGGAAVNLLQTEPVFINCLFYNNRAYSGGAVFNYSTYHVKVANCTFHANQAYDLFGGLHQFGGDVHVNNSIFWNNSDAWGTNRDQSAQVHIEHANKLVEYCCIENLVYPGLNGNINSNPAFADIGARNFRLSIASPCIDAGNNLAVPGPIPNGSGTDDPVNVDLDMNPRFIDQMSVADTGKQGSSGPIVDMGPYEKYEDCNGNGISDDQDIANQVSTDCNVNGIPDECEADQDQDTVIDACDNCPGTVPGATVDASGCPADIPGDFDGDGDVDMIDLAEFEDCATAPGITQPATECHEFDFNSDDCVDQEDFAVFQRCISGNNNPADPLCNE
jgi:hypothetical protein